jgi:hypothetical protein
MDLVEPDTFTREVLMYPTRRSVVFNRLNFVTVHLLKDFGSTLTNQKPILEDIKSRLKSRNACYHSVQNLLSSNLLSRNMKIKIYRTIILPVGLYGCEAWPITFREQNKLRVFENRVLRKIFGPERDEVTEEWRRLHNEGLNGLYSSPNVIWVIKSRSADPVAVRSKAWVFGRSLARILGSNPTGGMDVCLL